MLNRRNMLQGLAAGAAFGIGLAPKTLRAAGSAPGTTPKRVIFFLQNQGFDPATAVPRGMTSGDSLQGVELPEPIRPLEAYKDKINIITGLHGRHTSPSHSAFFGALGGYRGGIGVPPSAATIDHEISSLLPETILPHLRIGMDALENMVSRPTLATLSAAGPGQPLYMHSNPRDLYQLLFGGIATGDVKRKYEAESAIYERVEALAGRDGANLPTAERERYGSYVDGFRDINGLREKLAKVSDHLKTFVPDYDAKFQTPKFETDWHDALLEIGIAALKAGLTNVLTIGSGRGEIFGSWKGLGVVPAGHNLGHMARAEQPDLGEDSPVQLPDARQAHGRPGVGARRYGHDDGQHANRLHQQQRGQAAHRRGRLAVHIVGQLWRSAQDRAVHQDREWPARQRPVHDPAARHRCPA